MVAELPRKRGAIQQKSPMAQGSNSYVIQPYRRDGETWEQMNPDSDGQLAIFSPENVEEDAMFMNEAFAMRDDEAWSSGKMTAKVPPAYDGATTFSTRSTLKSGH